MNYKSLLTCTLILSAVVNHSIFAANKTRLIGLNATGYRFEQAYNKTDTIGAHYAPLNFTTGTIAVTGYGIDISNSHYNDTPFVGTYTRWGVRYSNVDAKEGNSSASGSIFCPYAIIGYNFGISDSIILGAGIGAGYAFGSISGTEISTTSLTGLTLVGDLNLAVQF
ncbi:hypothetical protein EBR96_11030 [bacterium]|nr:hypothetical protein [bacterium]